MKRAAALLAVLFACTQKAQAPARAKGVAPAQVLVAATLPIASKEGQTARFVREGYELAFEEANRAGGVEIAGRKVPLVLDIEDDADDAARGVGLLRTSKARLFLGSASPQVIDAQAAFAEQQQIPYVIPLGASRELFSHGYRQVFGLQAPLELLAYTQLRWIDEQQKAHRLPTPLSVALLVEESARGREFRNGVLDFVGKTPSRRLSYKVVFDESFPASRMDFTAQLARLKAAGADVFLADATLAEFMALHTQYLLRGLCHKVLSYGAHGVELDAIGQFGFDGLAYVLSAVWWTPRLAHAGLNRRFAASFKNTYHRDPDWYGALSYEAARALIEAVRGAGSAEPAAVRAQLAAARMESILPGGRLFFGSNQVAVYPFAVQQDQPDGSAPVVFPTDVAESPGVAVNPRCRVSAAER